MFCIIGAYSVNQQVEDVYLLAICGVVGFLGKKYGFEGAPLILGFILGPKIEVSLRQSLITSDGSFSIFVTRPISAVFIAVTVAIVITACIGVMRSRVKAGEDQEEF